jgi:hypothetical protein
LTPEELRPCDVVRHSWAPCLTPAGPAAEPWQLPDWTARAAVEIPAPPAEEGVDAAGVKVLCHGRARPGGGA